MTLVTCHEDDRWGVEVNRKIDISRLFVMIAGAFAEFFHETSETGRMRRLHLACWTNHSADDYAAGCVIIEGMVTGCHRSVQCKLWSRIKIR